MDGQPRERRWTRWILIWAGWTLIGLFFSTQIYLIFSVMQEKTISWWWAIRSTVPDWYVWALFTIFILQLSRRFRVERVGWRVALLVHIPASLAFSVLHVAMAVSVLNVFETMTGHTISWWAKFRSNFALSFHWDVLTYWTIVGIGLSVDYYHSYQERKVKTHQLEAQLAQAQLQALKMQMHPHFLFNTLNSISVLMNTDVVAARRMMARLGDFLRLTLQKSGAEKIPLRQELEFLNCYLEIEKVRFQDRLTVQTDIDPLVMDVSVPNLILQPIVENAIRYAIAPRSTAGRIEISAGMQNENLRLQVKDNGPGIKIPIPEGLGLRNTQARLQQMYGELGLFHAAAAAEGGTVVSIDIPARREA